MTALRLQQQLDLGPESHLDLLHANLKGKNTGIYFLEHDSFGGYAPLGTFPKPVALGIAAEYAQTTKGLYVSQQAATLNRRHCVGNVAFLGSAYVDLDHYTTDYEGQDVYSVLQVIQTRYPDLPTPTIVGSSGRGIQLVWCFKEGKPKAFLPHWQVIEDSLIEALKEFGADPKARDAARVLRVSQSWNPKSESRVDLQQIGDPVTYEALQKWSNAYQKSIPKHREPTRLKTVRHDRPAATVSKLPNKTVYTLAYERMQDYKKLAGLRGGRFTDYRRRAIFLYACAAAWYCRSEHSLINEINAFIDDYIASPERYRADTLNQVYLRHDEAKEGKTRKYNGRECDPRYRHRNKTLIRELDITQEEQTHLSTIIDKSEKQRRDTLRKAADRRSQGMQPQDQYLAKVSTAAQEQAHRALEMHLEGIATKHVAEALDIAPQTVNRYLRKFRELEHHLSACMS